MEDGVQSKKKVGKGKGKEDKKENQRFEKGPKQDSADAVENFGENAKDAKKFGHGSQERVSCNRKEENNLTLKIQVSFTVHSQLIGSKGKSVKSMAAESDCRIHFPDSNWSKEDDEKSNLVRIEGDSVENLELARTLIRESCPLYLRFGLPATVDIIYDADHAEFIKKIETEHGVVVTVYETKFSKTGFMIKGVHKNFQRIPEAIQEIVDYFCDGKIKCADMKIFMNIGISPQLHDYVRGKGNANVNAILKETNATVHIPTLNEIKSDELKPARVYINGRFQSVWEAKQRLIDLLPLQMVFRLPDDFQLDLDLIRYIAHSLNVDMKLTNRKSEGNDIENAGFHPSTASVSGRERYLHFKVAEKNKARLYEAMLQVFELNNATTTDSKGFPTTLALTGNGLIKKWIESKNMASPNLSVSDWPPLEPKATLDEGKESPDAEEKADGPIWAQVISKTIKNPAPSKKIITPSFRPIPVKVNMTPVGRVNCDQITSPIKQNMEAPLMTDNKNISTTQNTPSFPMSKLTEDLRKFDIDTDNRKAPGWGRPGAVTSISARKSDPAQIYTSVPVTETGGSLNYTSVLDFDANTREERIHAQPNSYPANHETKAEMPKLVSYFDKMPQSSQEACVAPFPSMSNRNYDPEIEAMYQGLRSVIRDSFGYVPTSMPTGAREGDSSNINNNYCGGQSINAMQGGINSARGNYFNYSPTGNSPLFENGACSRALPPMANSSDYHGAQFPRGYERTSSSPVYYNDASYANNSSLGMGASGGISTNMNSNSHYSGAQCPKVMYGRVSSAAGMYFNDTPVERNSSLPMGPRGGAPSSFGNNGDREAFPKIMYGRVPTATGLDRNDPRFNNPSVGMGGYGGTSSTASDYRGTQFPKVMYGRLDKCAAAGAYYNEPPRANNTPSAMGPGFSGTVGSSRIYNGAQYPNAMYGGVNGATRVDFNDNALAHNQPLSMWRSEGALSPVGNNTDHRGAQSVYMNKELLSVIDNNFNFNVTQNVSLFGSSATEQQQQLNFLGPLLSPARMNENVPTPTTDLMNVLIKNALTKYINVFTEDGVNLEKFITFNEADLFNIGVHSAEARKTMLNLIDNLRYLYNGGRWPSGVIGPQ